ncbi:MAG TPA: hypothetical protein VMV55_06245 [Methanoregula sp.]|nr:hypothetical protein [Methanoregula sp.]
MESLESKVDRLTPEQRKEVEDFVDFLIFRSGKTPESPPAATVPSQILKVAPPLFIVQEPVHTPENPPPMEYDTILTENSSGPVHEEQVTPFQEISGAGEDQLTRDYMDYGQFEQKSSPAIIAVKKVKEKLQKQKEQEKPRISLDWID